MDYLTGIKGNRTRGARFRAATATALAFFLMFSSAVHAELVDRIVATVNAEVITASELGNSTALNLRLGNTERDRSALEAETLDGLITRRLLIQEARRLRFVEVSDLELSAELENLRKRFASDKAFNDFPAGLDMTPQELAHMVRERLVVERFVEKKVGLFVRVSREEAQSYFNEHAPEFKGKRFQDVQKMILALLTEQKLGQQLDQYLAELRGKADIRISLHRHSGAGPAADR